MTGAALNAVTTVVGVPLHHADRRALVRALAEAGTRSTGPRFLLAGSSIVEIGGDGGGMEVEVYDHDPLLRRAFEAAARRNPLTASQLDAVGAHATCAYLVDEAGGSLGAARRMVRFAQGLLDVGGLGVKVESAGTGHRSGDWSALADRGDDEALMEAFVALVGSRRDDAYTCGLHNLGLPDVEVVDVGATGLDAAFAVAWSFARYLVVEQPVLRTGQTFSTDGDGLAHRLELRPCERFPAGDLFHNPFGVWRLSSA